MKEIEQIPLMRSIFQFEFITNNQYVDLVNYQVTGVSIDLNRKDNDFNVTLKENIIDNYNNEGKGRLTVFPFIEYLKGKGDLNYVDAKLTVMDKKGNQVLERLWSNIKLKDIDTDFNFKFNTPIEKNLGIEFDEGIEYELLFSSEICKTQY